MIPEKMRAAVLLKPRELVVKQIETPQIGRDEVLIRVKYCGICGTDMQIYRGVYSREFLPLIPGHEFVGQIAAMGEDVKCLRVGDMATVDINMGCGTCFYCRRNAPLLCTDIKQVGIHVNGAFAEYVSVPSRYVFRLPSDLPAEYGALVEPISCVIRSYRMGGLPFGNSVAIIGTGPNGMLHIQTARSCGAAPVIVIGRRKQALENAAVMGADYTLTEAGGDNLVGKVREITGGRGADCVVECVGKTETYELAMRLVRPGGRIIAFGIAEAGTIAGYEPFKVVMNELAMTGSVASAGNEVFDAINLIHYNRVSLKNFVSARLPLEDIGVGFERFVNDKSILKVLISMY
jgi:2-desacetyl-2-hydroxyethyl bacteriochlorophyllide A dehydrogenase